MADSRQRPTKATKGLLVGLALGMVATGCGGGGGEPQATSEGFEATQVAEELGDPVHGGTLTVGLEGETDSFLPSVGSWTPPSYNVAYAIFDTLLVRDESGQLQPYLAESFRGNDTFTEWTVVLRPGVTFHDGTPFDAAALQAVFDDHLTQPGSNVAGVLANVEELRVDGDLTATYVLAEPDSTFPGILTGIPGMPFSAAAAKAAGADAGSRPAGTGPFRLESWSRDDKLVVVKNEDYWREGLPYLDSVTFRPLPDERSRVQTLLTGGVDAAHSMRGSTIREMLAGEGDGITVHTAAGDDAGISVLNVLEPPFDDVRIRRAFAHTVNPDDVATVLGEQDLVPPATQFFNESSPWYSEKVAAAKPAYDLEEAQRLVQEYVNDPDRSDGKAVGEPPAFTYGCLPEPSLLELAQLTQHTAAQAGFEVEIATKEQAAHVSSTVGSAEGDPAYAGEFQANCFRLAPTDSVVTTFGTFFGEVDVNPSNLTNFHSPELDELLDRFRATADFAEQYAIVEEIGVLVNEAAPFLYGTSTPTAMGVRDAVKHVTTFTTPDGATVRNYSAAIARWGEAWLEG